MCPGPRAACEHVGVREHALGLGWVRTHLSCRAWPGPWGCFWPLGAEAVMMPIGDQAHVTWTVPLPRGVRAGFARVTEARFVA